MINRLCNINFQSCGINQTLLVLVAAACLSPVAGFAAWSGDTTITQIYYAAANDDPIIAVDDLGAAHDGSCANDSLRLDNVTSQAGGEVMLAALLAALVSGKTVDINVSGCTASYHKLVNVRVKN